MRVLAAVTAVVLAAVGVAACGSDDDGASSDGPITVGVVPKLVGVDFYEQTAEGAECAASKLDDVDVEYTGPPDVNITEQISILRNLITKQVDALDFAASDSQALAPIATEAESKGITVVNFDSGITPQGEVPLFATDNDKWARDVADRMAEAVGPAGGEVALLHFDPGSQTDNERTGGFKEQLAEHPQFKLVAEQNDNVDVNTALRVVGDILSANPNLKAIFAPDEAGTEGAAKAVERAGKAGEVLVFGWDAGPGDLKVLEQGLVDSLVVQNPFKMGYDSLNAAVDEIRTGETAPSEDTGATIVTTENLETPEVQEVLNPTCETFEG